ncbi:MAG: hypothetical protein ACK44A_08120 [Roseateles sp.]
MTPAQEANRLKGIAINEAQRAARAARRVARQRRQEAAERARRGALADRIELAREQLLRRYLAAYWPDANHANKEPT